MPTQILQNSPAQIVAEMLSGQSLQLVAPLVTSEKLPQSILRELQEWTWACASEPGAPDSVATIYDTSGQSDGRSQLDGELFEHHGLSLRLRSPDHPTGWLMAKTLQAMLAQVGGFTQTTRSLVTGSVPYVDPVLPRVVIEGNAYQVNAFSKISPVRVLGKDPKQKSRRFYFSISCLVSITPLFPSAN